MATVVVSYCVRLAPVLASGVRGVRTGCRFLVAEGQRVVTSVAVGFAAELGVYDSALGNWVKQDHIDRGDRKVLSSDSAPGRSSSDVNVTGLNLRNEQAHGFLDDPGAIPAVIAVHAALSLATELRRLAVGLHWPEAVYQPGITWLPRCRVVVGEAVEVACGLAHHRFILADRRADSAARARLGAEARRSCGLPAATAR